MTNKRLEIACSRHLNMLCREIEDRSVGSEGNRKATDYVRREFSELGWKIESAEFSAIDWFDGGAELKVAKRAFRVYTSPYSLGCCLSAELVSAGNLQELSNKDFRGKIIFLHREITREQLMPKNFVFYNPDEHKQIVSLLESSGAAAIISATGRNATLAGGVYPFPLIEDGDFDIPSVYMTEEEGKLLLEYEGEIANLSSISKRITGKGYNVSAFREDMEEHQEQKRIVVTAHIDAKKGSPGAIDNATGVVILLLLARLLKDFNSKVRIELVAFNGEDYYSAPGQMLFLDQNRNRFQDILLNINIDGAGYKEGKSAFSFYNLPESFVVNVRRIIERHSGIIEGQQWYQGDHSIFLQNNVPAIAVSSDWFITNIDEQEVTHTSRDKPDIVDTERVVEIAQALSELIREL